MFCLGLQQVVYEKIVTPADQRNKAEFEFFIAYIVRNLNLHGSTANPSIVATRVFVHGLKASSNNEQVEWSCVW